MRVSGGTGVPPGQPTGNRYFSFYSSLGETAQVGYVLTGESAREPIAWQTGTCIHLTDAFDAAFVASHGHIHLFEDEIVFNRHGIARGNDQIRA